MTGIKGLPYSDTSAAEAGRAQAPNPAPRQAKRTIFKRMQRTFLTKITEQRQPKVPDPLDTPGYPLKTGDPRNSTISHAAIRFKFSPLESPASKI
jgi:hypothetical protein